MSDLTIQLCRAARGLLGWSQIDLAAKSGISRATVAAFEVGTTTPAARTLRDFVVAFEAAGVVFIDPVAGAHQGAAGLKWGVDLPLRQASSSKESSETEPGTLSAAPVVWNESD